ncbi:winged helix-turn-helix domain-containing protein [Bradyrhizobium sp. SEMIA]|uniref:winged helix-turn-helix domain-containing protein n=1 Tax=Bradyrhizobium sp. SEMIA TaxID=2597515 RepID=UPI00223F6AB2|nr:winged helix-turn-helix domain-containing protein [Bradyrhizobium sp. SEMIA]
MLRLFATSGGRVLSKQELMEAVWPNVHVGEDSLFQCIRELRNALGDDRRQLIKLASGGGYLLAAEVEAAGRRGRAPAAGRGCCAAREVAARDVRLEPAGHGRRRGRALCDRHGACGCRARAEAGPSVQANAAAARGDADR